jgi:hypothetical protein
MSAKIPTMIPATATFVYPSGVAERRSCATATRDGSSAENDACVPRDHPGVCTEQSKSSRA